MNRIDKIKQKDILYTYMYTSYSFQLIVVSFGFLEQHVDKKQNKKNRLICMSVYVCVCDNEQKDNKEKTKRNKQDNHRRSIN